MALFDFLSSWSTLQWAISSICNYFMTRPRTTVKQSLPEPFLGEGCIQEILRDRAASSKGSLVYYPVGGTSTAKEISYLDLYMRASEYSHFIRAIPSFREEQPILLHLDEQWDTIIWFWAVLLVNGVPVLSSPFSNIDDLRYRHIQGLSGLFQSPICITRDKLLNLFDGAQASLQLCTVESLCQQEPQPRLESRMGRLSYKGGQNLAILMLTSGSTGNPKAVRLTHKQIITAISGKATVRRLNRDGPFLNWIGLDHVASLVEIHIQALWLGVKQVHVSATDVVSSPSLFLDLLSRHGVCRAFAPNFFLGRLVSTVRSESIEKERSWDLSNLQVVASGGEANDMKTCVAASLLFQEYGACRNVITPGFGMTETCAGSIFNLACPEYDVERRHTVASLGKCMKGIEMRVVVDSRLAVANEPGSLEVRGEAVFKGYYRNPEATADAFPSQDGWFRTGDQAYIDSNGNLCLVGRKNEVININGVKTTMAEVDLLLEQALGDTVSRFVVFPSRAAHTEQITVAYVPNGCPLAKSLAQIEESVVQACITGVSAYPLVFALREESLQLLPISALGKISRAKMSSLFEAGVFNEDVALHKQALDLYKTETQPGTSLQASTTEAETLLVDDFTQTLGINIEMVGPETRIFELGFTSMDLIRLKRRIDTRLGIKVPVVILLKNPTARSLAAALEYRLSAKESPEKIEHPEAVDYDPVVVLKASGTKAPLWLVHPGVGEALVFIGLAQHLADDGRPVYALRARGFEPGNRGFSSIEETVDTYVRAITQKQPQGPYALAGYSYGAMLAFEMAKKLDSTQKGAEGSSVRFLGSFNLPPHIKSRMRQLNWNMCILHLSQFLGLTSENIVADMEKSSFSTLPRSDALMQVIQYAYRDRMEELGLDDVALSRWADVAYGLQSMAVEYEPKGQVDSIDVFHAVPLKGLSISRQEWVSGHLRKWRDFSRTEPRIHAVGGEHYTLIGPEHVVGFAAKLMEALRDREI